MKKISPEIDKLAGIEYYSTTFNGIGGSIKKSNEDFIVKEIIDQKFLKELTQLKIENNIFPVYEIEKKGVDSNHAILILKKKLGMNFKIVGIKDARATTLQYSSSEDTRKRLVKNIKFGEIYLNFLGYSKKPI